jgi:methionyl-tRNA formyltransferase
VKQGKIILLSTRGNLELPYFIEGLQKGKIPISAVVYAGKISDKEKKIVAQRLEETFFKKDIFDLDISRIPFYFVNSHNSQACFELLKKISPDILINAGSPNILKQKMLDIPRLGVLNSHPGLLPDYKGCTCLEWAIYNDDPIGATCHFMTAEIDRGPILHKEKMMVRKGSSYKSIRTQMVFHSINVLMKGIKRAFELNKNYKNLPLPDKGTYFSVIDKQKMKRVIEKLNKNTCKWIS